MWGDWLHSRRWRRWRGEEEWFPPWALLARPPCTSFQLESAETEAAIEAEGLLCLDPRHAVLGAQDFLCHFVTSGGRQVELHGQDGSERVDPKALEAFAFPLWVTLEVSLLLGRKGQPGYGPEGGSEKVELLS